MIPHIPLRVSAPWGGVNAADRAHVCSWRCAKLPIPGGLEGSVYSPKNELSIRLRVLGTRPDPGSSRSKPSLVNPSGST